MESLVANDNYSDMSISLALFYRKTCSFADSLMTQKPKVFTLLYLNILAEMVCVDVCQWWGHCCVQEKSSSTETCMQLDT